MAVFGAPNTINAVPATDREHIENNVSLGDCGRIGCPSILAAKFRN